MTRILGPEHPDTTMTRFNLVSTLLNLGDRRAAAPLVTTLGMLRLQSFYQRIHGPAITIALGAGCILIASMLYFTVTQSRLVIHELLISVFVLMTAPVVSMLIMRAAVYRDLRAARDMDPGNDAGNS